MTTIEDIHDEFNKAVQRLNILPRGMNFGMPVIEDSRLVKKTILGPIRTHRKKRIFKKWLKKYGYAYDLEYQCMEYNHPDFGMVIVAHPMIVSQLRTKMYMFKNKEALKEWSSEHLEPRWTK
jgi:hypothetical protein